MMKVWSWRQAILESKLQATTKLVLLALSTYMNDHGDGCYPSQDQISLDTSLSKRAVITHIDLAVQSGFLIKDKRQLQGRKWDANEYRASIPSENAPRSPHDEGVHYIHPSSKIEENQGDRGEGDSPQGVLDGVNQVHVRGEPGALKLSSEPSKDSASTEAGGASPPEVDFKKIIFDGGIKLLGGSEQSARSLIGKWLRDYGDAAVVAAMVEAQKLKPVEPKAYLEKILKQGGKKHGNQPQRFAEQDFGAGTTGFATP